MDARRWSVWRYVQIDVGAAFTAQQRQVLRGGWVGGLLSLLIAATSAAAPTLQVVQEGQPARTAATKCDQRVKERKGFSLVSADTCLHALLAAGSEENEAYAAVLYRRILRQAGPGLLPRMDSIVRRHVAQMSGLLPKHVFDQVVEGDRATVQKWTFQKKAGECLVRWWREQDPLLRTSKNERLREHLQRVAYAVEAYPAFQRPARMDARGRVFVRYGNPEQQEEVTFREASFIKEVFRFGVPVSMSDFPENELWMYPSIDEVAYFLFVKQGSSYRLATSTNDLLPPQLRKGFGRSDRSLNKAASSIAALRHIYRQLAMYHFDFGARYSAVDDYVAQQEEAAMGMLPSSGQRQRRVGTGIGNQEAVVTEDPTIGMVLPGEKVKQTLDRSRLADDRARRRREKSIPRQRTLVLGRPDSLSVAVRMARFLNPDGTTRTEVYWGVPPGALALSERHNSAGLSHLRPLLSLTALRRGSGYERVKARHKKYLLKNTASAAAEHTIPPQQITFRSSAHSYHLELQWMQWLVRAPSSSQPRFALGPLVKNTVQRFNDLQALSRDESQLEMSDLQVMILPSGTDVQSATPEEHALLYPFDSIAPDSPLLIHFEVYHLSLDTTGRAHYTVEYEVQRRIDRGALARLFRSDREERTTTQSTYATQATTTTEYILIELSDWIQHDALRIVVQVQDEKTGQRARREVDFGKLYH